MKRTTIALAAIIAVVVSTGTALALDLSVAGFYSPGFVAGGAAEVRDVAAGGFKGLFGVKVADNLDLAISLGYNDFVYREEPERSLQVFQRVYPVISMPIFITTLGADYALPRGFLRPHLGAGGVLARESAEAAGYEAVDWYGGLYGDAGLRYCPAGSWALEAGPRYTYLFDEPAYAYDNRDLHDFERSPNRTQLWEFLIGAGYHF
jgi:hypothetical protein